MKERWLVEGATKDHQTITARWTPADMRLIDGVSVREVLNVPKSNGYLTEIFRAAWEDGNAVIDQILQVVLEPGAVSAWHAHDRTTDRLFITFGMIHLVLYDARKDSPTDGVVNEFRFGTVRPALVTVPPRIWHGIRNIAATPSIVLNAVDCAYDYENPDHWRVPHDSPSVPFRL